MTTVPPPASDTVLAAVSESLLELLGLTELHPETELVDSGVLSSLAMVGLIAKLERRFDIRIGKDDLELTNFRTPLAITRLVSAKTAATSAG
ncbi:Acyl carrier protein [Lentzea fradiae]|uniref:Acyl carrier protein n=1 Tax=Lentzea fradiae TaxID=200378 RepID=A0A1G7VJN9_9PSEU|nr:acyl carrier protein [Lentzea fradiae]SDG59771.1 Acyl carrier protein [Lentzea fradiae]